METDRKIGAVPAVFTLLFLLALISGAITYFLHNYQSAPPQKIRYSPPENILPQDAGWDVSARFDNARQGQIHVFSGTSGVIGTTYYGKFDREDNFYEDVPYRETCPAGWPADPNARKAKGWYAERKKISDDEYRILIRGVAPADCNYGAAGYASGELNINPDANWEITNVVKCSAQISNKGQKIYCETGNKYIKFAAGSDCGGCCACADSGGLDIEVIVEKK